MVGVSEKGDSQVAGTRTSLLSSLTGLFQKDNADVNLPTNPPETSTFTVTLNPEGWQSLSYLLLILECRRCTI